MHISTEQLMEGDSTTVSVEGTFASVEGKRAGIDISFLLTLLYVRHLYLTKKKKKRQLEGSLRC